MLRFSQKRDLLTRTLVRMIVLKYQEPMDDLKDFAAKQGIVLAPQDQIIAEAATIITERFGFDNQMLKERFDEVFEATERETYHVYLKHEATYQKATIVALVNWLTETHKIDSTSILGATLGDYAPMLDKFFLSLAQGRRARAGSTFENIASTLFRRIGYPFDEQPIINGRPDFVLPSKIHYERNPMDCIIFTSKRTLRERWRQIVTEGTRGLGFFLATIDKQISANQLKDMLNHRIYIVCPSAIKVEVYPNQDNVISFQEFFLDHVDPAIARWQRNGVIE